MATAFENLKTKLREAGCEVLTDDQWKAAPTQMCNLLRIYPPEADAPARCLVIDMEEEGYRLFIENDTLKIEDDVSAIMRRNT